MIGVTVICAGRIKEKYYAEACAEYIKRLGAYCSVEVVEIREERLSDNPSAGQIDAALAREAELIFAKIPRGAHITALCIEGTLRDSAELARDIMAAAEKSSKLCLIIGSSNGLHETIKKAAQMKLSMSKMTLPHSLARVVLLEQLYRAFSIAGGGKYHK